MLTGRQWARKRSSKGCTAMRFLERNALKSRHSGVLALFGRFASAISWHRERAFGIDNNRLRATFQK